MSYIIRANLPGGRAVTLRARSVKQGAAALRSLAARLGVAPLALDFSVSAIRNERKG